MRLYHPRTLQILANRQDIPKRYSCSVWSEIFKWKASGKKHPKMFIDDDIILGMYLVIVYVYATIKHCDLDKNKVKKLGVVTNGSFKYNLHNTQAIKTNSKMQEIFDNNYLFSDACSLYYKGINIFPDIFGDEWRKYIPVESHKEIQRQINKTLNKNI